MIDTDKYEAYKPTQSNYQTSDRYIKELLVEVKRLHKGIKYAIHYLTYPAKYDREVQEQTDKLKEMIE